MNIEQTFKVAATLCYFYNSIQLLLVSIFTNAMYVTITHIESLYMCE